jgi:parallel beta-helix repeat protein
MRWLKLVIPLVGGVILSTILITLASVQARPAAIEPGQTHPVVLYVSTHGIDSGNTCQDSSQPCQTIPRALQVAAPGDYIHVAGGTYTGSMYDPDSALGVTATVIVTKSISSLLGGYSADFSERDVSAYRTILDASSLPGSYAAVLVGTNLRFGGFTLTGAMGAYSPSGFKYPGGGLRIFGGSPTIQDNLIIANRAYRRGGGIYIGQGATPSIVNNTITSNSVATVEGDTSNEGGGIFAASGPVLIRDNRILSNTAVFEGAGIFVGWNVAASIISNTIAYNALQDGLLSEGAGIHTSGDSISVLIHDNSIHHNTLNGGFEGSAIYIGSPAVIDGNWIEENYAPGSRSAVCIMDVTHPVTVTNNIITSNTSIGIRLIEDHDTRLLNNTIVGNNFRGVQVLLPAGEDAASASFNLANNIISSNGECGVFVENSGPQYINYNDVVGQRYQYCGFPDLQAHNISQDPHFISPSTGDFHLSAASPAINQGDASSAPSLDYDDIQRRQYYNVDMGALEFIYLRTFLPVTLKVPPEYNQP